MVKTKPWGTTETLYRDGRLEFDRITVNPGGFCSRHFHQYKSNAFWVQDGVLAIYIAGRDTVYAGAGTDVVTVPAGCIHQFVAMSYVEAVELYRATPDHAIQAGDIHRFSESGVYSDPRFHNPCGC